MGKEISERYYVRRREFLNEDPELPAFIIGIVEDTRAIPDDDAELWSQGDIVLDLADCSRRISFYFNMYSPEQRANSLRKINLIAEVVNAVRDGIAREIKSRNARPEKSKEKTESAPAAAPVTTEAPRAEVFTSHLITLGL